MGKLGTLILLIGLALVGLRFKSKLGLMERAASYQQALTTRALSVRPGLRSVPEEAEIRASAEALAREFQVQASDIRVAIQEDAAPVGLGAQVADQMGALAGRPQVDSEGNVAQAPAKRLTTTLASVQVHIRAEGFLCSLEREVSARRNYGYGLQ
jgi:hypothetical protein